MFFKNLWIALFVLSPALAFSDELVYPEVGVYLSPRGRKVTITKNEQGVYFAQYYNTEISELEQRRDVLNSKQLTFYSGLHDFLVTVEKEKNCMMIFWDAEHYSDELCLQR